MSKGKRTPLSARERNGMLALIIIGFLLSMSGCLARSCDSMRGGHPGIIVTSDSDTLDTDSFYYERDSHSSSSRKTRERKKSRRERSDSTGRSSKKKAKPVQELPQRHHLQEDLSEGQ